MATVNLGRIKPVFRGAYSGSTAYVIDDIVTSGGSSYICIQAHGAGTQAVTVTAYWSVLASTGTDVGATITTQGDILYRDGSGLQRLAKGTAAQALVMNSGATAPEWGEAGGGSITYLATVTGTNVSALSLDGYFSSDYDVYKFYSAVTAVTGNTDTIVRYRASNADLTGSYYRCINDGGYVNTSGAGQTATNVWNNSGMVISSTDNNANIKYPVCTELTLYSPLATDRYKLSNWNGNGWNSNTDPDLIRTWNSSGFYASGEGSALSGISYAYDGGNITGTVRMYGIKNS